MPPSTPPIPTVLWTDTTAAARDGQIIDRMGAAVRVVGIGGPRTGEVDALARRLNCAHDNDFRTLTLRSDAAWLMIGSMQNIEYQDIAALPRALKIAALEPVLENLSDPTLPTDRVTFVPATLRSAGWISATDPHEVITATQLMRISSLGRPDQCSLFARLVDCWRTVVTLQGLPESIDAALTGPLTAAPEDPRGLTGHLAGMARLAPGRTLVFEISDRAGRHHRSLQMIGKSGQLIVNDHTYDLTDPNGAAVDNNRNVKAKADPTDFIDLIVRDWQTLITPPASEPAVNEDRLMENEQNALACALATMLSARTNEPESPAKLLALHDPVAPTRERV